MRFCISDLQWWYRLNNGHGKHHGGSGVVSRVCYHVLAYYSLFPGPPHIALPSRQMHMIAYRQQRKRRNIIAWLGAAYQRRGGMAAISRLISGM